MEIWNEKKSETGVADSVETALKRFRHAIMYLVGCMRDGKRSVNNSTAEMANFRQQRQWPWFLRKKAFQGQRMLPNDAE